MTVALRIRDPSSKQKSRQSKAPERQGQSALTCLFWFEKLAPDRKWFMTGAACGLHRSATGQQPEAQSETMAPKELNMTKLICISLALAMRRCSAPIGALSPAKPKA